MMEYTNKYWKMIMPLVKKSLVKRFGKEETALLVQKTDAIYREMLNRSARTILWLRTCTNV